MAVPDFRCGGSGAVQDVGVLLVRATLSTAAQCALTAIPMKTQPLFFLCMIVPNLDFHVFGSLVP